VTESIRARAYANIWCESHPRRLDLDIAPANSSHCWDEAAPAKRRCCGSCRLDEPSGATSSSRNRERSSFKIRGCCVKRTWENVVLGLPPQGARERAARRWPSGLGPPHRCVAPHALRREHSARRSRERSCANRRCCCSTNRSRRSMRSRACACTFSSRRCGGSIAPRPAGNARRRRAISLADRVLVLDEAASRSISTLAFRVRARRHSRVLRFAARAARRLGVEAHDDAPLEAFAAYLSCYSTRI